MTNTAAAATPTAVAYLRVSTAEQGASGLGLDAQRATVELAAARRGWGRLGLVVEVGSAKNLSGRPLLRDLLDRLDAGEAEVLVVAKADRLARNTVELLGIAERAKRGGWALVLLDLEIDTTTPAGWFVLTAMAAVSQLERDLISQRTREALAAKAAQGHRLGRPSTLDTDTKVLVHALRAAGLSLRAIAAELEAAEVLTATGRTRWSAQQVSQVLRTVELDAQAEDRAAA
jgi:DNA invertase Pin-like site-specific DNA recombinase